MKKHRFLALALAVCLLLTMLAGCSQKTTPETTTEEPKQDQTTAAPENESVGGEKQYGGKLVAYFTSFPGTCFLAASTKEGDRPALQPALEQVARMNPDGSVSPFLAESIDVDAENLTMTVKVRPNIYFHDGSLLNAEVLAWNLQAFVDNGRGSVLGDPIQIEATDDSTVVLHYESFANTWEAGLTSVMVSSKQSYEEQGADYMKTHAVGTGPFVMDSFEVGEKITYSRNENYWQEGLPYLDAVEAVFIDENTTLVSAFLNGEVHEIQNSEGVVLKQLMDAGFENQSAQSAANYSTTYIVPNSYDPESPWANDAVRQAVFNYGIDWDGFAYALTGGLGTATSQWTVPGAMNYDETAERGEYDLEKAKQMLADAGYPNGFSTVLWTGTGTEKRDRCTLLQAALKNLGIESEIEMYDDAVLGELRTENTPGIYITEGPSKIDMSTYIKNNFSVGAPKYQQMIAFSDAYNQALDEACSAVTLEEKTKALKLASRLLFVDEAKVITCAVIPAYSFVQKNVHDMGIRQTDAYEWTPEICWMEQ